MHASQPDSAGIEIFTLKERTLRGTKVPTREWILRINFSGVWLSPSLLSSTPSFWPDWQSLVWLYFIFYREVFNISCYLEWVRYCKGGQLLSFSHYVNVGSIFSSSVKAYLVCQFSTSSLKTKGVEIEWDPLPLYLYTVQFNIFFKTQKTSYAQGRGRDNRSGRERVRLGIRHSAPPRFEWSAPNGLWRQTYTIYSTGMLLPFQVAEIYAALCYHSVLRNTYTAVGSITFPHWITVCAFRMLWNGFLPILKEMADVSMALWYEKFNLKGWEKELCTAYFHSPTPRDMRMMFYCEGGNYANRTAEKFLHNSIQFPLNPNGKLLCQREGEWQRDRKGWIEEDGGRESSAERDWDWDNGESMVGE